MRRRVLPIAGSATLLAALALSACSTAPEAQSCEPSFAPGALSDSVKVSGSDAASLRIQFDLGTSALSTQRTVVSAAKDAGTQAEVGSIVAANFAFVNSTSGEMLEVSESFGTDTASQLFILDESQGSLVTAFRCATPGDTLAIALSEAESAMANIEGSLLLVAEVTGVFQPHASGKLQQLPAGFPEVVTDENGRPGVVLPPQQAPQGAQHAVRVQGEGDEVTAKHQVIGQALTVTWDGLVLKNTWETGPESFGAEADIPVSGVTFRDQLTGHRVGSQLVVIEQSEDGATLTVVDILAIA